MLMTVISFIIILATTYVWMTRGFFSALLHMACTVAAGAIAFAVWEPAGYWLLGAAPDRGFGSFLGGMAWAIALAVPFAVALAALRGIVDSLLPANAQCDSAVDYIGGGICGLVSGVVTAGIVVLSVGLLRVGPDFMGYQPVMYSSNPHGRGSIEANTGGFVPWADRLTASLYERLSLTSFRTSQSLAEWHPDFEQVPGGLRMTYEGKNRNTMPPDAMAVERWYTVGDMARPAPMTQLLRDKWMGTPQEVVDVEGNPITQGYVAGFVVNFGPGAKEKSGHTVIGNGQVRLVVERDDGRDWMGLHPVAVISSVSDPASTALARFRYDADNVFISSVGGASEAPMAFEFAVPAGYRPKGLYVKNVRYEVPARPHDEYPSPEARDADIDGGRFVEGRTGADVGALPEDAGDARPRRAGELPPGWRMTNGLGRMTLQVGQTPGLETAKADRTNWIVGGEGRLSREQMNTRITEQSLRVNQFATTPDTVMFQVDLVGNDASSLLARTIATAEQVVPPVLVDTQGREYPAIGFVYSDSSLGHIRFTPGQPLRGLSEAPGISVSRTDQNLMLLFRVNRGAQIVEFRIGNRTIQGPFDPPIEAQGRR